MSEKIGEKCAVFGIYGKGLDVARLTFFGLYALQHRGQESSGIAVSDGQNLNLHREMGLVAQVYKEEVIKSLKGYLAIGHNRYSTSQTSIIRHAQPVFSENGLIGLAHNGNLPSTKALEEFLHKYNVNTEGFTDSELMTEAIARYVEKGLSLPDAVKSAYPLFTGAFSLLVMDKTSLVALRDPYGIRPLSMARINDGFAFSSETCAFKPIGASVNSEILPGQMVVVNERGAEFVQLVPPNQKFDIFEFVYFARPDSTILGKSVYQVRYNFGKRLAEENRIEADMVVPVPDTAIPAAIGYSQASGTPMHMALIKNRYIHRTFIEPEQHIRDQGVKLKLTALPEILRGKRVILIDDSIVRGTTAPQIVKALFEAGAKEVHMLVSSAPIKYPDFYGIDLPDQNRLIAFNKNPDEIRKFVGATSLNYLSFKGMVDSTGLPEDSFCTSCFTGVYPLDIKERVKDVAQPAMAK